MVNAERVASTDQTLRAREPARFLVLPLPAREIRNSHKCASFGNRRDAEWKNTAPSSGIIDGHVQGQAFPQAMDQSPVHHIVHTPMTTGLLGLDIRLLPERVAIFLVVWRELGDPVILSPIQMEARRESSGLR